MKIVLMMAQAWQLEAWLHGCLVGLLVRADGRTPWRRRGHEEGAPLTVAADANNTSAVRDVRSGS
jgi:hypothetical protein